MNVLRCILPLAAWLPLQAGALELFGVELETVGRDALRAAVEQAGVVLIRERDETRKFDVYDSSAVLPGSTRLYLGFTPDARRVAFVEYEFVGRRLAPLRARLTRKYGEAAIEGGQYLSDHAYSWRRDGIDIRLVYDWENYRTRLSYIEAEALGQLRAAAPTAVTGNGEADPISFF